jgi:hypothetical protein
VPFPEDLWALATSQPPPARRARVPIGDAEGPALRGGRADLGFPRLVAAAAAAFLRCALAGADAAGFCHEFRDTLALSRTVYLGPVPAGRAAALLARLHAADPPCPPRVLAALRRGAATLHLSVRAGDYGRPLRPVLHALFAPHAGRGAEFRLGETGPRLACPGDAATALPAAAVAAAAGSDAAGAAAGSAGACGEWVDRPDAESFRRMVPKAAAALTEGDVLAVVAACGRAVQREPSVAAGAAPCEARGAA